MVGDGGGNIQDLALNRLKKTMNWMDQVDLRIFREIGGILISQKFRFEVLVVKSYLCSGSSRKYRRFAKFWLKPTARRI
jgi:hypothetical protein